MSSKVPRSPLLGPARAYHLVGCLTAGGHCGDWPLGNEDKLLVSVYEKRSKELRSVLPKLNSESTNLTNPGAIPTKMMMISVSCFLLPPVPLPTNVCKCPQLETDAMQYQIPNQRKKTVSQCYPYPSRTIKYPSLK